MPLGDGCRWWMVDGTAVDASWVLRRRNCEPRVLDFVGWFNGKIQRANWGKLQVGVGQSGALRTGPQAFLCGRSRLVRRGRSLHLLKTETDTTGDGFEHSLLPQKKRQKIKRLEQQPSPRFSAKYHTQYSPSLALYQGLHPQNPSLRLYDDLSLSLSKLFPQVSHRSCAISPCR